MKIGKIETRRRVQWFALASEKTGGGEGPIILVSRHSSGPPHHCFTFPGAQRFPLPPSRPARPARALMMSASRNRSCLFPSISNVEVGHDSSERSQSTFSPHCLHFSSLGALRCPRLGGQLRAQAAFLNSMVQGNSWTYSVKSGVLHTGGTQ